MEPSYSAKKLFESQAQRDLSTAKCQNYAENEPPQKMLLLPALPSENLANYGLHISLTLGPC